ncbi:MAG: hypothetical protein KatS3mg076_1082 [Candidatus Binatia bacterium]|nr:MAG: hypothetical protein KatS3mg076_1082 [Candidatus Binatia bacterium]
MGDWITPDAAGRLLVTAFFAVVFGQSGIDKLLDRKGNLEYLREHFRESPFPPSSIPWLLSGLTALECAAALLCALGILSGSFFSRGWNLGGSGVATAGLALLALMFGQRLAKDYAGAAVVASYFAVALLGILLYA